MIHKKPIVERIRQILDAAKVEGERILPDGTWLVSPAPEIAPQAWHHALFAPALSFEEIEDMENALNARLPTDLRNIYLECNGFKLFGHRISLWGKRRTWERTVDKVWQPFDMVHHNQRVGRPGGSPPEIVFIGGLDEGTKWVYFETSEEEHGRIGVTPRELYKPLKIWPDFNSWIQEMLDTSQDPELIVKDSIG